MARFDTSGIEELLTQMQNMGHDTDKAAKQVLLAGAEAVKVAWKRAAEAHGLRDTGAMIESIGYPRGPTKVGDILTIDIYPQGTDAKGVRNATKAFVLHYGTSKIKATRWVDDADAESAQTVPPAMQAAWDEFLSKLG